jgi:hypothetical protein
MTTDPTLSAIGVLLGQHFTRADLIGIVDALAVCAQAADDASPYALEPESLDTAASVLRELRDAIAAGELLGREDHPSDAPGSWMPVAVPLGGGAGLIMHRNGERVERETFRAAIDEADRQSRRELAETVGLDSDAFLPADARDGDEPARTTTLGALIAVAADLIEETGRNAEYERGIYEVIAGVFARQWSDVSERKDEIRQLVEAEIRAHD